MNNEDLIIIKWLIYKVINNRKMPSIRSIHKLFNNLWIKHWFYETQNECETNNWRNTYVNKRWEGKKWYEIKVFWGVHLDTSNSYYSRNSKKYAREIIIWLYETWHINKKFIKEICWDTNFYFNIK